MNKLDYTDIYDKLDKIFIEHTTHNWKNGWQDEGDRLSEELTIQKEIKNYNSFLLTIDYREVELRGDGYKISIRQDKSAFNGGDSYIRIDITNNDKHTYFNVDTKLDWESAQFFIIDICKKLYQIGCDIRSLDNEIQNYGQDSSGFNCSTNYGSTNPPFLRKYKRDNLLNNLLE